MKNVKGNSNYPTGATNVEINNRAVRFAIIGLLLGLWASWGGIVGCTQISTDSPVLAVVNGRPITQDEFDYRWGELPESTRGRYQNYGGQKKFLDDLITREILLQEARRQGLDRSIVLQERVERVKEQLMLDELMKEVMATPVQIPEAEIQAYYDAHRSTLLEAIHVRAAHILVSTESQANDVKRLLNQGYNFGRMAQRYSIDETTRANGGEIGTYRPGVFDAGIEEVLLTLKAGMVSEPIPTPAGFHLVKVISRVPDESQHLEAAQQRLRQELFAEKRRQQVEAAMVQFRSNAMIRVAVAPGLGTHDGRLVSTASQ